MRILHAHGARFVGVRALCAVGLLAGLVRAEGTESLGSPDIATASASNLVAAGTGAGAGDGVIEFDVPAGSTVRQVLLYWSGFATAGGTSADPVDYELAPLAPPWQLLPPSEVAGSSGGGDGVWNVNAAGDRDGPTESRPGNKPVSGPIGDATVSVNGLGVEGKLIGGPTLFGQNRKGTAFRADVTNLNLVQPGPNVLVVSNLNFSAKNDGVGVVVLYEDGNDETQIILRDGHDLAFSWLAPPLDATVAQSFLISPAPHLRSAMLKLFVGDADPGQANELWVTIDSVAVKYGNVLGGSDGATWDSLSLPLSIPPDATSVTVEIVSGGGAAGTTPASLAWIMAALVVQNGVLADCDFNGIPDACDLSCSGLGGECGISHAGACGLGSDCNGNNQPDACDLAANDCNQNGVPDTCEGAAPPCNDGNACTINDRCAAGVCVGTPLNCAHLNGACVAGQCNPATGQCRTIPAHTGGACDDGVPCTHQDFCWNGACVGFEPDCSALDDTCAVGACNPASGDCEPLPVNDGGVCDDADLCTSNDTCADGVCSGVSPDCSSLDGDCVQGACDPVTGLCEPQPVHDGDACNDGDACTVDDFCSNGACVAFEADCSAFDDACNVGACNTTTGLCDAQPVNDGGACDDGDACTEHDTCASGSCTGTPIDCSVLDDACVSGVCLGTTGICTVTPVNDGGACDDGDACTTNDDCLAGVCGGEPVDCSALDDACNAGVCIGTSGLCAAVPLNEGGACDDGDPCTIDDACAAGICGGAELDCSGLDSTCTLGVCDGVTGTCVVTAVAEGDGCDDGDECTVDDVCVTGVCEGLSKDCSSLDDACNLGACVGTTGVCVTAPFNEGGLCNDGDGCTVGDTCADGVCLGDSLDCSALDEACAIGVCVGTSGLCAVEPAHEGETCDDGDRCTVNDSCRDGACAGEALDCSALDNACNQGVCDPGTGDCVAVPRSEGGLCDDGDPCTQGDICSTGVCAGTELDCSPFDDACHLGVCDPTSGACTTEPRSDGTACDDGDDCTEHDVCAGGACAGVTKDCSGASDACNVGTCIGTTGVCASVSANEGGACDDGDACTTADACRGGACAGDAVDCSALDDACNLGVCVGSNGACAAVATNDAGTCDDGDLCTVNDTCSNGVCHGEAVDCSALDDACNVGMCDPGTGVCLAAPAHEGGACDDGNACTESDACSVGECVGLAKDCTALADACNDGICVGTTGVCSAVPARDGGSCDDGDGCTSDDACIAGACIGESLDCSAWSDGCNIGACVGTSGVCIATPANPGGVCDDGDACTSNDTCAAGVCAGTPVDCSGLDDACVAGVCDPATGTCGVQARNDGGTCDDGDLCTQNDICSTGICAGAAVDCTTLDDACNVGACDPATGTCVMQPAHEGATCDDGKGCTVDDVCGVGGCAGTAMSCGSGMVCDESRAACVAAAAPAGLARVETTQKGSLLIFPKVELRWDAAGNLLQDTFLTLTNDFTDAVQVQMYFVNGDAPADAITMAGVTIERSHPGWNHIDVEVTLTGNQPTYWSFHTGMPIAGGIPPWTILDPGLPPGRPDLEAPGERTLRGYVIAWAVDNVGREIRWNHLSGSALVVDYGAGAAWEYSSYAFQIRNPAVAHGGLSGSAGELRLDGEEYDQPFDLLEFAFYGTGFAPLGPGATSVAYDTDLTLLPISVDLTQEGAGPITTKASFTVWNQNEVKLTGLDRCISCWDERLFANYGGANHLLRANLQTDLGRAQINGLASQMCNVNYNPGDGLPVGSDPRDLVSVPAALGGVIARQMCFGASGCDAAGETLGGAGTQSALILVDFLGTTPPERPEGN